MSSDRSISQTLPLLVVALLLAPGAIGQTQSSAIRTRYAGSDGPEIYFGVACPNGAVTRLIMRTGGASDSDTAPRMCYLPPNEVERCVVDGSRLEVAELACAAVAKARK